MINNIVKTSLFVSVAVIILWSIRKIFKKNLPHNLLCLLWLPIIFQLCIPYQIHSKISLYQPLANYSMEVENISLNKELPKISIEQSIDNIIEDDLKYRDFNLLFGMYIIGIFVVGIIKLCKYIKFKKWVKLYKLSDIELYEKVSNIWKHDNVPIVLINCEEIRSAALFGFIKPILLVSEKLAILDNVNIAYIIKHEEIHYKYKHLQLLLLLEALSLVYWFNPIVLWSFKLMKEDLELLTDSKLLENMDTKQRKDYASLLIEQSRIERNIIVPGFTFNSKKKVKERIRNIMEKKNMMPWMVVFIIVCMLSISTIVLAKPILETNTMILEIPLSYRNFNKCEELIFETDDVHVSVQVELPKIHTSIINENSFEAYVDMLNVEEGEEKLPINIECYDTNCKDWKYGAIQKKATFIFSNRIYDSKTEDKDKILSFVLPINNPKVSCQWYCYEGHQAVDIVDVENYYGPIFAVEDGVIIENEYDEMYGNYLKLKVSDNVVFMYAHMQERSEFEEGVIVNKGDIIGKIGSTGKSTGPHLELSMEIDGKKVNPELYFDF